MHCTVRELLERMTTVELRDWLAFYSISPWDGTKPLDDGDAEPANIDAQVCKAFGIDPRTKNRG